MADASPTLPPTPHQLELLALYLRSGSEKVAAHAAGISRGGLKEQLRILYRRLGVSSHSEAARALGWLRVPDAGALTPVPFSEAGRMAAVSHVQSAPLPDEWLMATAGTD